MDFHAEDHIRFECRSCTACCRTWPIPVGPEEVARIAAHDWAAEDARFGAGFLEEGTAEREGAERVLRRVAGACVFLDEDGLCRIHKRLGAAAKPDHCRLFPLAPIRAPDGRIDLTVVPECESWHESFRDGPRLREGAAAEIATPLPERLLTIAPPALPLRAGGPLLLWDAVRALSRRLGALAGEAASLDEAFGAFPATLREAEAASGRSVRARPRAAEAAPGPPAAVGGADGVPDGPERRALEALAASLDPPLAAAARGLVAADARRAAFEGLPAAALAFARAVVRAWIEGPALAQARVEIEAALGLIVLFARLLPARARAIAAAAGRGAAPTPRDVNLAAKELSVLLRAPALPAFLRAHAADLRAVAARQTP